MEIELNVPETEIAGKDISVETVNTNIAVSEDTKDLDITYNRKEYSIIGDGIFISSVLDDVPEWLGNLIDSTFEAAILNRDQNLINRMEAILTALDYVPKNRYTEQINQIVDEDGIINSRIATLNSNLTDALNTANATIAEIDLTYASKNEAAAIATNVLTASLSADGEIGSSLIELQNAYADLESTTAESITLLESVMEGEINGNASAMQTIRSYVGINEAGAGTGTGLSAYLEGSNGTIGGADSQLVNDIKLNAEVVESKFEYGSTLNINGQNYISGFGLVSSSTPGVIGAPVSGSEFWISADKFKLSASGGKGSSYTPFSVNATTGDITFKGKVTFGNNQSGTIEEAIASTIETVQVGDKNINITDNLIPVTSLVSDTNNASYQFIGTPTKSNASGIDSFAEPQIMLDGIDEVYSPYVDEVTIPYYFRVGIKGITSLNIIKVCTINSSSVVTYGTLTYTMNDGEVLDSGSWYIVDGIINPVGGNTTASGSIRKADGTKIGTINNYPIPSGALKIILGFVSDCTISRMKLSKITADTLTGNYVTQDYVDSSIANKSSSATKNEMAVAMGFTDYDAMVAQFLLLGSTIINGGYINTGLLEANSILASKINTTGLIAENISANEIIGKNIEGGRIIGARIEGAVIKASYLDLNGELEVLTNFIITIAMYNANKSLYSDAVYIAGDDQYRIPTLSVVSEPFKNYTTLSMNSSVYGTLRPYNSANVGHNLKAVKIRPVFQNIPAEFLILSTGYSNKFSAVAAAIYVDNSLIGTFRCGIDLDYSGGNDGFFSFTGPYVNYSQGINNENHTQVDITGIPVLGTVRCTGLIIDRGYTNWGDGNSDWNGAYYVWTMSLLGGDGGELPFNWTGGRISIKRVSGTTGSYTEGGVTANVQARLNGISINNMI